MKVHLYSRSPQSIKMVAFGVKDTIKSSGLIYGSYQKCAKLGILLKHNICTFSDQYTNKIIFWMIFSFRCF
jgi:hypothetical protein